MNKCMICGDEVEVDECGICKDCNHKLDQQEETGRCGWCGHPLLECICE
jgi:DNA-directed RNA polymerase subunit RPC12/RpoP